MARLTNKDYTLLKTMQQNCRTKVTDIARGMNIPVTTIYDKIRVHEREGIIKRHATLLDFSKMGYPTKAHITFKTTLEHKKQLQEFLTNHPSINSLSRINYGHDFITEAVFQNPAIMQEFLDEVNQKFTIQESHVFNVIDELQREQFMQKQSFQ